MFGKRKDKKERTSTKNRVEAGSEARVDSAKMSHTKSSTKSCSK